MRIHAHVNILMRMYPHVLNVKQSAKSWFQNGSLFNDFFITICASANIGASPSLVVSGDCYLDITYQDVAN